MCPFRSKKKRAAKTKAWFERHRAERAAYMRKYRRKLKKAKGKGSSSVGPPGDVGATAR